MSRSIHKLTARQVDTATKPGRYGDGAGLYLRVTQQGQKRWVYRYTPRTGAKPRETGLGTAGKTAVTLAMARQLAQKRRGENLLNPPSRQKIVVVGKVPAHTSG